MSAGCTICVHEDAEAIDLALGEGLSLRTVAERHAVSRSTLARHVQHQAGAAARVPPGEPAEAPLPPAAPAPAATASPRPTTRVRTCPICALPDPQFEVLDEALGASAPSQSLALEHGVGLSDMTHHVTHRQSEALSRQRFAREQLDQAPVDDPRDPAYRHSQVQREITDVVAAAEQLHQQALRAAGLAPVLFVVRDMSALLVTLAQAVAGEAR